MIIREVAELPEVDPSTEPSIVSGTPPLFVAGKTFFFDGENIVEIA